MSGPEVHVAPALVRKAGTNAAEVGRRSARVREHLNGATPQVEKDFAGWQSAAALAQCANAWEAHISDLTAQVNRAAGNLVQSADNYDAVEARLTAHINRLLSELEGER